MRVLFYIDINTTFFKTAWKIKYTCAGTILNFHLELRFQRYKWTDNIRVKKKWITCAVVTVAYSNFLLNALTFNEKSGSLLRVWNAPEYHCLLDPLLFACIKLCICIICMWAIQHTREWEMCPPTHRIIITSRGVSNYSIHFSHYLIIHYTRCRWLCRKCVCQILLCASLVASITGNSSKSIVLYESRYGIMI